MYIEFAIPTTNLYEHCHHCPAQVVSAPTVLREVVSLAPGTTLLNGLDGAGPKVVTSSALLLPTIGGGDPSPHHHLTRLAEVAVQQAHLAPSAPSVQSPAPTPTPPPPPSSSSLPASPASEGMHSGRSGSGTGHSQGQAAPSSGQDQAPPHPPVPLPMLSAGASPGFRGGSLTHGEPVTRGGLGSQYGSAGGNGAPSSSSSMGAYSSLYGVHGQSSPLSSMSPYPGFFTQYPASSPHYSPQSLVASAARFPHIESYSAVLASMGSHVQHGGHASPQGQGARTAYHLPAGMGQYQHRALSSSGSPSPSSHSPGSALALREREALLLQQQGRERERSPSHSGLSASTPPDDKGLLHSPGLHYPQRGSPAGLLKEARGGEPRDPFQKVPSGKEGSLKHRILTRPSDVEAPTSYVLGKGRPQPGKGEEEVGAKQTKYMGGLSSATPPPDPHVFLAPHTLGPAPSASSYCPPPPSTNSTTPSPTSPSTTSPASSSSHRTRTPESGPSPGAGASGSGGAGGSGLPPHLHYPPHFLKGSIIQLANGDLKRVEDLQTEDFVSSAQVSADLKVDSSTVVRIEEHPDLGTATLGFSVGEHRVQVSLRSKGFGKVGEREGGGVVVGWLHNVPATSLVYLGDGSAQTSVGAATLR